LVRNDFQTALRVPAVALKDSIDKLQTIIQGFSLISNSPTSSLFTSENVDLLARIIRDELRSTLAPNLHAIPVARKEEVESRLQSAVDVLAIDIAGSLRLTTPGAASVRANVKPTSEAINNQDHMAIKIYDCNRPGSPLASIESEKSIAEPEPPRPLATLRRASRKQWQVGLVIGRLTVTSTTFREILKVATAYPRPVQTYFEIRVEFLPTRLLGSPGIITATMSSFSQHLQLPQICTSLSFRPILPEDSSIAVAIRSNSLEVAKDLFSRRLVSPFSRVGSNSLLEVR
jgi:hypothetical protein